MINPELRAAVSQCFLQQLCGFSGTNAIHHHAYSYTTLCSITQRLQQWLTDSINIKNIGLQADGMLRTVYIALNTGKPLRGRKIYLFATPDRQWRNAVPGITHVRPVPTPL